MGLWTTLVLMPKTAVDLDYSSQPWKHQVRSAGKGLDMQSVAVAHPMHEPPHGHLWRRVLASDTPHILAAPLP
jgi:hypothetical protein